MEGKLTRKLCRLLEKQGAMTYPLIGNKLSPIGWPDRYICHVEWQGFIEFKEGGRLRPAQRQVIEMLRERGENAHVVRLLENSLIIEDVDGVAIAECDSDSLIENLSILDT